MGSESSNQGQTIWKDRKRICGLPITFTRYSIRNNRLFVSKGLFSIEENEILLYRILDFKLQRTLFDRIFGVGTITLFTCDETHKELKLEKIKKSSDMRDRISIMVEEERAKLGIKGREIYGVAHDAGDING